MPQYFYTGTRDLYDYKTNPHKWTAIEEAKRKLIQSDLIDTMNIYFISLTIAFTFLMGEKFRGLGVDTVHSAQRFDISFPMSFLFLAGCLVLIYLALYDGGQKEALAAEEYPLHLALMSHTSVILVNRSFSYYHYHFFDTIQVFRLSEKSHINCFMSTTEKQTLFHKNIEGHVIRAGNIFYLEEHELIVHCSRDDIYRFYCRTLLNSTLIKSYRMIFPSEWTFSRIVFHHDEASTVMEFDGIKYYWITGGRRIRSNNYEVLDATLLQNLDELITSESSALTYKNVMITLELPKNTVLSLGSSDAV